MDKGDMGGSSPQGRRTELVEALCREHESQLLQYLTRMLGRGDVAREVLQDTYERIHKLYRPEDVLFPRAMLYKIATNFALMRLRRARLESTIITGSAGMEQVPDEAAAPDKRAMAEEINERLVQTIPAPEGEIEAPLQALIIDSWFDNYLGVVSLVRVKHGRVKKGNKIVVKSTGKLHQVDSVGVFSPKHTETPDLMAGEVGFIIAGIKDIHGAPVGDTLTLSTTPDVAVLPGFKRIKPQVYAGLFPVSSDDFEDFREALQKLTLNDAALQYEPESSEALGFGFRIGFLGMLHMEIIQERLEREYDLDLITTAPTVIFEIVQKNGDILYVDNPSKLPDLSSIDEMREPICRATILVPQEHLGNVITLCIEKRGVQRDMHFLSGQVQVIYDLPMNEVVLDFFDRLKSTSRGYASLDYSFDRFEPANLVRLDVLINGEKVDALALIVHRDNAPYKGRQLVEKMKELIPRQMFDVAIQAAIGGQIIARSTVKALRKNVLAKCYGGDVSRKRKLLEKQKAGKKRMKQVGSVEIPQEAFLAVLKVDS